jgi:hypothetical protein
MACGPNSLTQILLRQPKRVDDGVCRVNDNITSSDVRVRVTTSYWNTHLFPENMLNGV